MEKTYEVEVFNIQHSAFQTFTGYTALHIKALSALVAENMVIVLSIKEEK